MINTFDPVSTAFKVAGDGDVLSVVTSANLPIFKLSLQEGNLVAETREFVRSELKSKPLITGLKRGHILRMSVSVSPRGVIDLQVDEKTFRLEVNWPSYRGETIKLLKKATRQKVQEE